MDESKDPEPAAPPAPPAPPAGMSPLAALLAQHGLQQYAAALEGNGVSLSDVGELTMDDLQTMGIDMFMHRKNMVKAFQAHVGGGGGAAAAAPAPAPPGVGDLAAFGGGGGAAANEAGSIDKFCAPTIEMGQPAEAAHGLADLMGITDKEIGTFLQDPRRAIAREFERHGSAKDKFNFELVATGQACENCAGKTLEALLQHPDAVTARLKEYHVLALRLYTTTSYSQVNNPLRGRERPHPFAATTHFISEGIKKLRAVAAERPDAHTEMTFWRGMRNLQVSMEFMAQGGTEFACLSTSASPEIARKFADSECPLVFKFTTPNFMSRGADIAWLSVFPDEKETLYPPLTYLRPVTMGKEDVGGKQMLVSTVEPQFPS